MLASAIVSLISSIIPSVIQSIKGSKQQAMASKLESEYPLPEAQIAPSVNKYSNYAFGRTLSQDIPGGELYRNEIKGATAAGIKAASELGSGSEAYGALGQMIGREQNQFGDLAKLTAQQVAGYQRDYLSSLLAKGQEENRIWEWNKARPYLQAANMASQLRGTGQLNTQAGLNNVFGSLAEFGSSLGRDYGKNKEEKASRADIQKWIDLFNAGSSSRSGGSYTPVGPGE